MLPLKKINEPVFIAALVILIVVQVMIRKFVTVPDSGKVYVDLIFNFLLCSILFGYYIRKYNPDLKRKIFMGFFVLELVIGIFLKKIQFPYSNEILWVGLLGSLFTWLNTHSNRHKFSEE